MIPFFRGLTPTAASGAHQLQLRRYWDHFGSKYHWYLRNSRDFLGLTAGSWISTTTVWSSSVLFFCMESVIESNYLWYIYIYMYNIYIYGICDNLWLFAAVKDWFCVLDTSQKKTLIIAAYIEFCWKISLQGAASFVGFSTPSIDIIHPS